MVRELRSRGALPIHGNVSFKKFASQPIFYPRSIAL
jgi:hypothetical protein